MLPSGPAKDPSGLIAIALPVPDCREKIPGAEAPIATENGRELPPALVTTIWAVPESVPAGRTFQGTCKLICAGETYNSGARTPLKVTETPPRDVGRGIYLAEPGL